MTWNVPFMYETFLNTWKAVPTTLKLTFIPFLISVPFAFLLAMAQIKKVRFWSRFAQGYVSFVRGIPVVVLVLLFYNTLPGQLAAIFKFFGSSFNVYRQVPGITYAYFIFSLTAIAALTEIFRAALSAVDKGQLEAAYAIGLNAPQAYVRIIFPQAIAVAWPNLCNLLIMLVKNTSLAFMMTVKDITQTAKLGAALNYCYAEAYTVILIIYVIICLILEQIFRRTERYLNRHLVK
ncbi:MAG: amino acid ABC transporter permease [Lachnospiraceae bacterium]|nr:amino acid ABC transporter permease [Lachnospiraceae bacterium]